MKRKFVTYIQKLTLRDRILGFEDNTMEIFVKVIEAL